MQNLIPFIKPALLLFWYHCYIVCNTGINIGIFFSLNILTKYPDFDSQFPKLDYMYRWCKCYLLWEKNYLLGKKLRTSVLWKPIYTGNVLAHCIANFETPLMTSPIVYAFSSHGLYIPVDTDGNTRHLRATRQTIGTLNSGLYLYHQLFSCACLS